MAITDNFNRASLGTDWAKAVGTSIWVTVGSTVVQPVTAYQVSAIVRTESAFPDDQYAQALCKWESVGDPGYTGVMVRCNGSNTYYAASVRDAGVRVVIWEANAGGPIEIGSFGASYTAGTYYTLKLEAIGTGLKLYVDGIERISITDATITSGKPGLWAVTGDATHPDVDDFESTDAVASVICFTCFR